MSESGEGGPRTRRDLLKKGFQLVAGAGAGYATAKSIPLSGPTSTEASNNGASTATVVNKLLGK